MYIIIFFSIKYFIFDNEEIDYITLVALIVSVGVYFISSMLHGIRDFLFILSTFLIPKLIV